jgi:large subunit ribosomal protein L13
MSKQTKMTPVLKEKDIKRNWHLVDLKNKILGRAVSDIAIILQGKNKRDYSPNLDCGDYVVAVNSKKIKISGKKADSKMYTSYSGYPGGLKIRKFNEIKTVNPNYIIKHAVNGMLPKNKLAKKRISRLYIFEDEKHNFAEKFNSK